MTDGPARPIAYVGVGSNIDPEHHVVRAVQLLHARAPVLAVSTFYRTEPIGAPGTPAFVNGVLRIDGSGGVEGVARTLDDVERALGRRRSEDRNAPRVIDLDLLLLDASDQPSPVHPDVEVRSFVAVPLLELAPALTLPDGRPLAEVAAAFSGPPGAALADLTARLRALL